MKAYFYTFISGFITCALPAVGLYWYCRPAPTPPKPPVMIAEQGKTQTEIIKTPTTCDELRQAAQSPIIINRSIDYPYLYISASDGYKKASVKDTLAINPPSKNDQIFLSAGLMYYNGLLIPEISTGYARRTWGPVFIGGFITYTPGGVGIKAVSSVAF